MNELMKMTTSAAKTVNQTVSGKNGWSLKGPLELVGLEASRVIYLLLVYLVTALVPSDTACLASSPGRSRRTAVWISRLVMVERLL